MKIEIESAVAGGILTITDKQDDKVIITLNDGESTIDMYVDRRRAIFIIDHLCQQFNLPPFS